MTHPDWIAGNIIVTPNGERAKILARIDDVIMKSGWSQFDVYKSTLTVAECITQGWYVMAPGDPVPMKQEELEKMLGYKIKLIEK